MTSARRVTARDQLPRRDTGCTKPAGARKLRLGPRRGEGHCTGGECAQAPGCPSCSGQGRHKTQAQQSLCFCGVLENLNLSSLGLESAGNSGPAPWRAAGSPSSVDGESTHALSGSKPSVAGTPGVLPTQASEICLQRPPPRSMTEQVNLNKRLPPPTSVRAETRH